MILRRAFLKRMAQAALACALLGDIQLPGLEAAPEPIETSCTRCDGSGFIMSDRRFHSGVGVRAEGGYLPEPANPQYEKISCPECNNPWKKVTGNKDAFEAYMTNYSQVIVRDVQKETHRMFFGAIDA